MFGWSPAELAIAFTLNLGISALPMILAGKAQDYVQPKTVIFIGGLMFGIGNAAIFFCNSLGHLYLWYGILAGLGMGIVYSGGVTNIVKLFPDKRGLAAGILAAGFGSGALIWAPVAARLVEASGVLSTFGTLGIIYLILICSLALIIPRSPENFIPEGWVEAVNNAGYGKVVEKDWKQMLQDPIFYVIAVMFSLGTFSGLMIIAHASPMMQWKLSFTPQQAAAAVGIISLFNTCGRIGWGALSDKIGRLLTMLCMYVTASICMYGLIIVPANYTFVILIMIVATCFGGFMAMIASLTADTFGSKNLPINFGFVFLAFAVAAYFGPRIAAQIKMANNGDYSQAFVLAAALGAVGIIVTAIAGYIQKNRKKKYEDELSKIAV
jgi:OFA family oxalate/formate antiporter-like MFS transporter